MRAGHAGVRRGIGIRVEIPRGGGDVDAAECGDEVPGWVADAAGCGERRGRGVVGLCKGEGGRGTKMVWG